MRYGIGFGAVMLPLLPVRMSCPRLGVQVGGLMRFMLEGLMLLRGPLV